MRDLNVTIVQDELVWQDAAANRARLSAALAEVASTDLVLLPEMFASGFSMSPQDCAEPMDGPTVDWLRRQAAGLDAAIGGSLAIATRDGFVNRFVLARPDGTTVCYDKRHLFTLAGEDRHYLAGRQRVVIEFRGWRILPFICYDLRFPVWCRSPAGCDLMVFVANWPRPRQFAWSTLLRARAIENQCYVAGVNRVGLDGNHLEYGGGSAIVDYFGATLADAADVAGVHQVTLSAERLLRDRAALPFFRDADPFDLRNH